MATGANGERVRTIEPADELRRGDTVVLVVEWRGARSDAPVIVSSAIPRQLAFQQSSADAFEVSTDGGSNWGRLGTMRIDDRGDRRLAAPEDVTHLRWRFEGDRGALRDGRVTYSAIVR